MSVGLVQVPLVSTNGMIKVIDDGKDVLALRSRVDAARTKGGVLVCSRAENVILNFASLVAPGELSFD